MNRSESIGKIAAALAKAQKAIEGASKDAKNPHFNSRYADLASIVEACKGPLAENEIAVLQSPSAEANFVKMTTLLVHSSGEFIESDPLQVQARDAAPQAVGSCLTYLRRYQLAAMVGVAPEDDDAEAAEGRSQRDTQGRTLRKQEAVEKGGIVRNEPAGSVSGNVSAGAHSSPKGAVLISDFQKTPTKNPTVSIYTITVAGGPDWPANQTTLSTRNSWLAAMLETHFKNQMPIRLTTKKTEVGYDILSVEPAEAAS